MIQRDQRWEIEEEKHGGKEDIVEEEGRVTMQMRNGNLGGLDGVISEMMQIGSKSTID